MEENITQDPAQIIQSQSPMEVPSNPSNPWLKIALFAVLGLFLAGGLVFAGMQIGRNQAQVVSQPISTPRVIATPTSVAVIPTEGEITTPTLISTPTPDPTANWKTYTNTKYGYSIKYPPETRVEEGPAGGERLQEAIFMLFGPKAPPGPSEFTDGFGITLAVIKNPNNKNPAQFAQEYYQQAAEDINNKILEGDISKCKVENVVKGNISGVRFTYCTQVPGTGILNFSEWYVKNGVTSQINAVLQNENYLTIFNLMLSTFRFLD